MGLFLCMKEGLLCLLSQNIVKQQIATLPSVRFSYLHEAFTILSYPLFV
ncbi:hypothetical protein SAM19_04522 [Brevibacillus laterosporus]|nr:hypothetical protein [Brevibacillus laterosporus]